MKKNRPFHLLLIHPPVKSPAHPPGALVQAAAALAGLGLSVKPYDANLDFYLDYLCRPQEAGFFLNQIKEKKSRGVFAKAGAEPLFGFASQPEEKPDREETNGTSLDRALGILRSADFYEPELFLAARAELNKRLELASLAFYPSFIKWGRFYNPTLSDWPLIWEFCQDPSSNPFIPFCQKGLRPHLAAAEAGLLVFLVTSPDQAAAALTMARWAKKEQPDVQVALWGDHLVQAQAPPSVPGYWDSLLPAQDPQPLKDLAARLAGRGEAAPGPAPATPPSVWRDLPWEKYLAPEKVLPLNGDPGQVKQIREMARRFGVKGLLLADQKTTAAQLAELAAKPPVPCIGLKRTLAAGLGEPEMGALYQAGVRLICWQAPAVPDDLKFLIKTLVAASGAGLWNHVLVPQKVGPDHPLVKFLLANPNIGHSWARPRDRGLFSSGPTSWEDESAAYPRLPGRPWWQAVADPAHLLLYVSRHGAERLKRWRVREDERSLYTAGENITYQFLPPKDLPPGFMEEVIRLVLAGGSGLPKYVEYNLRRAFLIGLALEEGAIVGAGSLKYPRPEYVESVKQRSGLNLSGHLERGYTTVRPAYRGLGIGTKLLEGETKRAQAAGKKVFSVISEDNLASQKMALRNNTRKVATFYSQQLGKNMGIWMPSWMLDDK